MLIWPKFSRLLGNVWGVICAGFTGMVFDGIVVGGRSGLFFQRASFARTIVINRAASRFLFFDRSTFFIFACRDFSENRSR